MPDITHKQLLDMPDVGGINRDHDGRYLAKRLPAAIGILEQSDAPTTDQFAYSHLVIWINEDNSKCYLCYNQEGTIKKVELT